MDSLQPSAHDIWTNKYQVKDKFNIIDKTPLDGFKRVAERLASCEKDSKKWEKEFIWAMENGAYPAGRILSNAGAEQYKRSVSLINCTVSGIIDDDMESIMEKQKEAALTLKAGCGIGYNWSTLRPKGAFVHGAGASTSGPLSFMDIYNAMCFTISSAGGRRGAQMGCMSVTSPDVIDFIKAKREAGRLRQFNLSLLITDEFIEAVRNNEEWQFTWDNEPFGDPVKAADLWDLIMRSTYEYAEPGFLLIDYINFMNNNWFCEEILATNPLTH